MDTGISLEGIKKTKKAIAAKKKKTYRAKKKLEELLESSVKDKTLKVKPLSVTERKRKSRLLKKQKAITVQNISSPVIIPLVASVGYATDVGVLCAMTFKRNNIEFMVVAVYISPGTATNKACDFLIRYLSPWSLYVEKLMSVGSKPKPMILCGDFNIEFSSDDGKRAVGLLKEHFDLDASSCLKRPAIKIGSVIDAVFSRYLDKTLFLTYNFVTYFNNHMPHISCINRIEK